MNATGNTTSSSAHCPVTFAGDASGSDRLVQFYRHIRQLFIDVGQKCVNLVTGVVFSFSILAMSDLLVGLFVQPFCAVYFISNMTANPSLYCSLRFNLLPLSIFHSFILFIAISIISVDPYLVSLYICEILHCDEQSGDISFLYVVYSHLNHKCGSIPRSLFTSAMKLLIKSNIV